MVINTEMNDKVKERREKLKEQFRKIQFNTRVPRWAADEILKQAEKRGWHVSDVIALAVEKAFNKRPPI